MISINTYLACAEGSALQFCSLNVLIQCLAMVTVYSTMFWNLYEGCAFDKFHSFMFKICSLLSPHQDTPLHMAADRGHTDTLQYLVGKGAGINIRNEDGVSE